VSFRVATLNLERDEKRWSERRGLILQQLGNLRPDVFSLNEVWLPIQTGRWLQEQAQTKFSLDYHLIEQPRADKAFHPEAEGLLAKFPVIERSHRFFSARDTVTLVVRLEIQGRALDAYVTHLYPARREDSQRVKQVKELLAWIDERDDVDYRIVCGDCNAPLEADSMKLMAEEFRPTQSNPTAFTPLREVDGEPTHPDWGRFDRCIDFIWISKSLRLLASGRCFDAPSPEDETLWPSDHAGVWADLELV
jgi:endonuclease/exonuclease/phosphatase family metal-dependent hydrolase